MIQHTTLALLCSSMAFFPLLAANEAPAAAPLPPDEAARRVQAPPGFVTTVFASEPDVRQPIAISFDDRGRVWIAECHTYAGGKGKFDDAQSDRIVIFEDADQDGRAEKRKVFWDGAKHLTSVAIGFGGVWALCAPNLLFIPDRNRDDVPDGPPEPMLDGFDFGPIGHNVVNGLKWGPDGWLYGRHGIQSTSAVGRPGAPAGERTELNCSIWRYHPTRRTFNVVCQGGTNSWGHDWNEHGQLFWVNTVIGHLWHGIPGAYCKRMYGEHLRPHLYELIDQHADHFHWDARETWSDIRKGASKTTDSAGGGHAHSGLMVYLGDNWPEEYRGGVFMVNYHGRRLNHDRMERSGSGYIGRHRPDAVQLADPWFRGVDLAYGPDGGVFVIDWSDTGECHESDADGAHRENGRIYKIAYGTPKKPPIADVAALSDAELVALHGHPNEWFVRQARRVLQERAVEERPQARREALRSLVESAPQLTTRVRALWTLHAATATGDSWLRERLGDGDEVVRATTILILTDGDSVPPATVEALERLAASERSPFVLLHLASALQRIPIDMRLPLASALLGKVGSEPDHNLPLLIWYGIEPILGRDPLWATQVVGSTASPILRRLAARRVAERLDVAPEPVDRLLSDVRGRDAATQLDVLRGLAEALRGWRKATAPPAWSALQASLQGTGSPEVQTRVRELAVVFGDGRAIDELRQTALAAGESGEARRAALVQLIEAKPDDLFATLSKLVGDRHTAGVVVRGLAAFDRPEVPGLVLRSLGIMNPEDRPAAVAALASRSAFAIVLVRALKDGTIARGEVSAFHVRQILGYGDEKLAAELREAWGEIRSSDEEKTKLLERYKTLLTAERLAAADRSGGRAVFNQVCASCHKLYGEGGTVSIDLTGSGRADLGYLLENIVDPSAIVPADYRLSTVTLKDGRVLSGVVAARTERTLALQTPTERLTLDRADLGEVVATEESLMPSGLLETLDDGKIADLIAYLLSPVQVPLPAPGVK